MSLATTLELTPAALNTLKRCEKHDERLRAGIVRGMDKASAFVVSDIQARRLTGQGPFPVSEHRLGVVTNRLRSSLRHSRAQVNGNEITSTIGTSVKYARIHEVGGTITMPARAGHVFLKADRKGNILKRGNLATFAKAGAKRVVMRPFVSEEYEIKMPARAPIKTGITENKATFSRFIDEGVKAATQTA